jgi:hypothetical protein
MKTRWLPLVASIAVTCHGWAEEMKPSEPKVKEALQSIVQKQLAAFRKNDFAAAYVFADDGIKTQFPLEAFAKMVKGGYPEIAKSASESFGITTDNGVDAVVIVRVVGDNKHAATFRYVLKFADKVWRVAGVVKVEVEDLEV